MAKVNRKTKGTGEVKMTHGGSRAMQITKELELRRTVLACMLWEENFYEDGVSVANRISKLIQSVKPEKVAQIAREARTEQKLRHVPLLVAREMARSEKHRHLVAGVLADIIQRPDELTEFLSIYWKDGRQPLANQVKKGLAAAFPKFDEYQLAKYNKQDVIKLRDVLFMTHAKPKDKAQAELWKRLVDGKLETPDTWEVNLSTGKDKKDTFTRMIKDGKLGAMALMRNLRGMTEAGVSDSLIREGIESMNTSRVLPFRFLAAAKHAPRFEKELEQALIKGLNQRPKLEGRTIIVVDVSGSMNSGLSNTSEMTRMDAACVLATILRELSEDVVVYATAGNDSSRVHATTEVPSRNGFALCDAIKNKYSALGGGGIFLVQCMDYIYKYEQIKNPARIIVITDEQDCDIKLKPESCNTFGDENYLINIASYKNGVGYGKWTHIDGWSEHVVDYIPQYETMLQGVEQ